MCFQLYRGGQFYWWKIIYKTCSLEGHINLSDVKLPKYIYKANHHINYMYVMLSKSTRFTPTFGRCSRIQMCIAVYNHT